MLLIGLYEESVLEVIGDTKPFLLVAALAGTFYGLRVLAADK